MDNSSNLIIFKAVIFRVMPTSIGWVITGLAFMASVEAYFVTVDAHAEECFFDKVTFLTHLKIFHLSFSGEVRDKNGPHV